MKTYIRQAGLFLLVVVMVVALAACGQQATTVTQTSDEAVKVVEVETAPPSPTPTPTPTPSVPPVAVTTVPMPMPSVTPTVSVTAPEGGATTTDAAATSTASPAVSPSPSPTATTGTADYYSPDAAFASTITPDGVNIPAGATTGYIIGNDVNLRAGPSTSARLLGTYDSGTKVTILDTENGWTEVVISGVTGYVKSEYVRSGSYSGNGSAVVIDGNNGTLVIVPDGPVTSSGAVIAPSDDDNSGNFLGILPD